MTSIYCAGLDGECFDYGFCESCTYNQKEGEIMSIVYDSSETAKTINRAIDNNQGTTTTEQGASAAGLIIKEDLQNVVQCTAGYMNPFVVKTISGEPPVEFHAIDHELISWSISGNTDTGVSVGTPCNNLFNKDDTSTDDGYKDNYFITESGTETSNSSYAISVFIPVEANTTYTLSFSSSLAVFSPSLCLYDNTKTFISGQKYNGEHEIEFSTTAATAYVKLSIHKTYAATYMLNIGETALPYEPYYAGYAIPIECGNITTTAYISDVLRKSSGETPVYDIMYSDGTITRNVDTDGTPLETPTTETYTPVTISTIWGFNTFDVDTTVTPSSVSIEYYDN